MEKENKTQEEKALLFDLIMAINRKEFDEDAKKLMVLVAEYGNERFKTKK